MPYSGYQGFQYLNQETQANDYVRKHDPLILFQRIVQDPTSLTKIKNFTEFDVDYKNQELPQWAFITPNMTNDGHDSSIQVAGNWAYNWLTPLLNDTYFTQKTLVVLTFDENETYADKNKVFTLLLGDIPEALQGTTDDTYYDHYTLLSSVQANWGLPNLGRGDCGANVFQIIANVTGFQNKVVDTTNQYNNQSGAGWISDSALPLPAPQLQCQGAGGGVYSEIVAAWSNSSSSAPSNSSSGANATSTGNATTSSAVPTGNGANTLGAGTALVGALASFVWILF
jgi:acid phosphatase